jgi:hypothetical protein
MQHKCVFRLLLGFTRLDSQRNSNIREFLKIINLVGKMPTKWEKLLENIYYYFYLTAIGY